MAVRYWVGGGASTNWNATSNTNWATSSGGANNASVPTTGDEVIFDANSGSGTSVMNVSLSLVAFDCNGFTGTLTHNSAITLTISGNDASASVNGVAYRLGSGMTYTVAAGSSANTFTSTSGTTTLNSNGKLMANSTFNGAGGTFTIAGPSFSFSSAAGMTLTAGTFDCATNNPDINLAAFASNNSNTREVKCGNGTWTFTPTTASGNVWDYTTITGLTHTKNSSNFVINCVNSPSSGGNFVTGGNTIVYNNITFNGSSSQNREQGISGAIKCNNLTLNDAFIWVVNSSATSTIQGVLTCTGTSAHPVNIYTQNSGGTSFATIDLTNASPSNVWTEVRGIHFTTSTFTAASSFDQGGNTGVSITNPATTSGGGLIIG